MAKLTLSDITGGYQTATAFNANNALIEAALENTLSRDGTAPNNMDADFDLNSYSLNNVASLNMTGAGAITGVGVLGATSMSLTSLTLNGQAITTSTTLVGGLNASEITYDSGALDAKLDADFLKTTGNYDMAGTLDVTGLLTADAGVTAGGDINVTGDIVVSGTVDGIDVATLDASVTTLDSEAIKLEAVPDHYVRVGNYFYGDGSSNSLTNSLRNVSNDVADNTFESYGPTGSGATNIWTALDNLPTNAVALLGRAIVTLNGDGTSASSALMGFAKYGVTGAVNRLVLAGITGPGGQEAAIDVPVIIPCDSERRFQLSVGVTSGGDPDSVAVQLRTTGYVVE